MTIAAPPSSAAVLDISLQQFDRFLGAFLASAVPEFVFELRAFTPRRSANYVETECGFFAVSPSMKNPALRQKVREYLALSPQRQPEGVYITLNPVKPELLARANNRMQTVGGKKTISATDAEVLSRRWLLIDVDPVRPSGISATDGEKEAAACVMGNIRRDLAARGWPEPMLIDSGNGFHLWARIELPANDGQVIERCLKALAARFNTAAASVDTSVFNPSRIAKIPGTWARKGDPLPDRPHRLARVLEVPAVLQPVPLPLLEVLAAAYKPKKVAPAPPTATTFPKKNTSAAATRCRAYLQKLPPAVAGQHGHDRTFEAARLIWNDFGLEEADGWPLLAEYNARCEPPWSEKELRHKWETAVAKGAGPQGRGCKLADRDDQRASQPLARPADPPLSPPPASAAAQFGIPTITIGPDEYRVNNEAVAAMAADAEIYSRAGQLVRVVAEDKETAGRITYPAGPRIVPVSAATLRERLTLVARWQKVIQGDQDAVNVPTNPPQPTVQAILDRGTWSGIRPLVAITEYPVMLPDGGILVTPGYDRQSGLLYAPRRPVALHIPDSPTREDARRAAAELLDVVSEFPFAGEHHKAAWLAAVLSPLARFAFDGPTPMFLAEGNVPGCGKGLLADTIALIVRGAGFAVTTFPAEGEELRKRVTALLLRGSSLVLFDNIAGRLGGADLDALLTSATWEDRILGESRTVDLPVFTTWYGTGNNVAVTGDTLRRVCPIRLESREERPEERTDIKRTDLRGWVEGERPRLLSAALTILRAYHLAGRPPMKLPQWGSFERWSDLVRGAVVWAGRPDPWEGRKAMREDRGDEQLAAMGVLLRLWPEIDGAGTGLTAAKIVKQIDALKDEHELVEVLCILAGGKPTDGKPDNRGRALGYRIREFTERTIGSRRFKKVASHAGINRWGVEAIDPAAKPVRTSQPDLFDTPFGGDGGDGGDVSSPTREPSIHPYSSEHTYSRTPEGAGDITTISTIPTRDEGPDPYEQAERDAINEYYGG